MPHELLAQLEREGVKLTIKDGKLFGSRSMTTEQRALVSENKSGLIAVLTHQCPVCNQVLRINESAGWLYLECVADKTHYSELRNKRPGEPMGFFSDSEPRACDRCQQPALTYIGRCLPCIESESEMEMRG